MRSAAVSVYILVRDAISSLFMVFEPLQYFLFLFSSSTQAFAVNASSEEFI